MKTTILSTNVIFGGLLLYSYYYYYIHNKKSFPKLWGNIQNKQPYIVSIFIAAACYLYILGYLLIQVNPTQRNTILLKELNIQQIILIIISILWTPLSIMYIKNEESKPFLKLAILLVLFIVSMCSLLYYKTLRKLNVPKFVLICALIFFAHVFFGDFILWSYNFF